MDRTERFYRIELMIRSRGGVSFQDLQDALAVSRATLKRDLKFLRERMDAPIVYHRGEDLYRFGADRKPGTVEKPLPGLWFSESEIHALLTMHQLLGGLDASGVLGRHVQPLQDKLRSLLGRQPEGDGELLAQRVHILTPARRPVPALCFERVGSALLARRRLEIRYFTRSKGQESQRVVSPQRLIHYRNTWYLDAWCHRSEGLRRFALDAVRSAQVLDEPALDWPLEQVQQALDGGYGIFSGQALEWATLAFSAKAAQWVAQEIWHPLQTIAEQPDGSLLMRLPYADATELAMDLMRHGPQVRVLSPPALVELVAGQLAQAAALYALPRPVDDRPA